MSEEPKKSRRRRRRPRSSAKNRAKSSTRTPSKKAEKKSASEGSSSGGRRGRSRRRNANASKSKDRSKQDNLTIQRHTERAISPINKDIFIYTYTLRPRSLLDEYEAGPNIAEKMAFEQTDEASLKD